MKEEIRRILIETIDATFMKKGFRASTHADAVLEALHSHGYSIIKVSP